MLALPFGEVRHTTAKHRPVRVSQDPRLGKLRTLVAAGAVGEWPVPRRPPPLRRRRRTPIGKSTSTWQAGPRAEVPRLCRVVRPAWAADHAAIWAPGGSAALHGGYYPKIGYDAALR
jgi:hypothetical protein